MSDQNDAVFPHVTKMSKPGLPSAYDRGLTKREYFAGMAMQGLITGCYAGDNVGFTVAGNVFAAVEYADALLKALEGREDG